MYYFNTNLFLRRNCMKRTIGFASFVLAIVFALVSCKHPAGGGGTGGSGTTATNWVRISGCTFNMGSSDSNAYSDENNVHAVTLSSYLICDHEVTQAEWEAVFSGAPPSNFDGSSGKEAATGEAQENRPVENVNWYMAIAYCNKLSIKEGLTPCYGVKDSSDNEIDWTDLVFDDIPTSSNDKWNAATCNFSANGYRLPTEAEWECAARGGIADTSNRVWAGTATESELAEYAWYTINSDNKTHEEKKKPANGYGLYDMSGNVLEWCWDWYGDTYSASAESDPTGPSSGSARVLRGGSWRDNAQYCAVSSRDNGSPEDR
ncbi:MAG: formylglycine-generating enzyme family protein, partial [Treponema sp.]|nr:formylglycine-generating enzyme family protein [Treponema sp.]